MSNGGIGERYLSYAKTREGIVAHTLGVISTWSVLASALAPHGSPADLELWLPIAWASSWGFARLFRRSWERRTWPATPAFARGALPGSSTGPTLREDHNACLWTDRGGLLWERRGWFWATRCAPVRLPVDRVEQILSRASSDLPCRIATRTPRTWWWYEDAFYWENGGYSAKDVRALVFKRKIRHQHELEHAHALLATQNAPAVSRKREAISEAVKREVFRRDGGRCQRCGSNELLQFDHVIPFSMGGSDEPENLQLLCAPCNREKGGTL